MPERDIFQWISSICYFVKVLDFVATNWERYTGESELYFWPSQPFRPGNGLSNQWNEVLRPALFPRDSVNGFNHGKIF